MITITVNGVEYGLPVQTDDLQDALDRLYDAGRLSELVDPYSLLGSLTGDWPTPPTYDWPRPRLGSLYWPVVGRALYAFGCYLIDEYTLGQVRAGMTAAGSNAVTVNFYDDPDDGAEVARTVPMRFLATRPLSRAVITSPVIRTTDDEGREAVDAWVLVLVDSRYAALHAESQSLTAATWDQVFTAGGITLPGGIDAVDTDYLNPSSRWSTDRATGRPLAWLMDIAAACVGSRIVTTPAVASRLQRPHNTNNATLANAHSVYEIADRMMGGGTVAVADSDPGMPDDVKVVFGGPNESTPVVVTVASTGLWPAGTTVVHWCDAPASTAVGQRTSLAAQWDADWRFWQKNLYDTTYSGFVEAPASGFLWAVEWFHSASQGYTKFVRPPHWYGYLIPPSVEAAAAAGITVEAADTSPTVASVTTLRFDEADGFVVSTPGAGIARVDLQAATSTQAGIVSTGAQTFGGTKTIDHNGAGTENLTLGPGVTLASTANVTLAGGDVVVPSGGDVMVTRGANVGVWLSTAAIGLPNSYPYITMYSGPGGTDLGTIALQTDWTSGGPSGNPVFVFSAPIDAPNMVATDAANTWTELQTFQPPGAATPAMIVQGFAAQTADIFIVEDSAGSDLFNVQADGDGVFAGAVTATGFTGDGSGLTALDASELTGSIDGGSF